MTQGKQLTDRVWHLFENGQLDELASLLEPDCHFKMPGFELRSSAALVEMLAAYRVAFPDLRHEVKTYVESGDTIAIELEARGTHTGPMQTPAGTVAATGKQVVWESCDYVRFRNGKLSSWHVYHDPTPFLTALGLLPKR